MADNTGWINPTENETHGGSFYFAYATNAYTSNDLYAIAPETHLVQFQLSIDDGSTWSDARTTAEYNQGADQTKVVGGSDDMWGLGSGITGADLKSDHLRIKADNTLLYDLNCQHEFYGFDFTFNDAVDIVGIEVSCEAHYYVVEGEPPETYLYVDHICVKVYYLSGDTLTKTITTKSNIKTTTNRTLTAITRIENAGIQKTSTSKAKIYFEYSQVCTTKGSIYATLIRNITTKANIQHLATTRTATIKGNIASPNQQVVHVIAKARIYPSTVQQTAINNTQREVGAKIEIKWDGLSWNDESTYFLSAKGTWEMSGQLGEGLASQADFELENTTKRFLPENTSSPICSYLLPRKQLRFYVTIEGTNYLLFTGYIKAIEPSRKSGKVNLHCFDNAEKIMNIQCPRNAYVDYYAHELIQVLGERADLDPSTQMDLENSHHLVRAAYFGDRNIWPVMGEIAVAERGRIFYDIDGRLKFWSRDHIQEQKRVTTLTQATHLLELEFSVEEQHIKNRVTVRARPRASSGIQPVWTNGNVQALNQYTDTLVWIPANGTQYAYVEIEDSYGPLPCTDWIRPVANTDYEANSVADGSGTDYTGSITINSFVTYADACYLEVQNHTPVDVYLTKFQVRANPLKIWKWISVRQEDEWSVAEYGAQEILIENDFIDDEQMANDIAEVEVKRWKNAKDLFRARSLGVPYLQLGDVVGLEVSTGVYEDYMIYSIDWDVDTKGFIQTLQFVDKIDFPVTETVDCGADIKRTYSCTVSCKANLGTATKTVATKARITEYTTYKKTMTIKGGITGNKVATTKGNIKAVTLKTLTCKSNIT